MIWPTSGNDWTPPCAAFGALSTSSGPASTPQTCRGRDEAFHYLLESLHVSYALDPPTGGDPQSARDE